MGASLASASAALRRRGCLRAQGKPCVEQRCGEDGADALARAQAEVEQRLETEALQDGPVSALAARAHAPARADARPGQPTHTQPSVTTPSASHRSSASSSGWNR